MSGHAPGRRRLLLVANDHVGERMTGPAIRYVEFARALRHEFDVTFLLQNKADLRLDGVRVLEIPGIRPDVLTPLCARHDVVVAQHLHLRTMTALARTTTRTIYDLYDPLTIENLAYYAADRDNPFRELFYRYTQLIEAVALATGDAFVCASERQRDLWLGALAAAGRLGVARYEADPSLRDLVDVVPFGLPESPPQPTRPRLKGVLPGIDADDRVLLWGGGVWNWLDPLTPIRAVGVLARRRPDVKLLFLGVGDPNPHRSPSAMIARAESLARELGLLDRHVFFNRGWTPYEERADFLLEADLGVSAHLDSAETRFAFRTRLLDYLWAGLPIVTTGGDVLGELVRERGLGRSPAVSDVDGWVRAIEELLDSPAEVRAVREKIARVSSELTWPRVTETLARLARRPGAPLPVTPHLVGLLARFRWLQTRTSLSQRGVRGSVARVVQAAAGRG